MRDRDHARPLHTQARVLGKIPSAMTKPDRIRVMAILEERGAFHIKRSVDQVAKTLGVSRVTAYNYLDEIRHG